VDNNRLFGPGVNAATAAKIKKEMKVVESTMSEVSVSGWRIISELLGYADEHTVPKRPKGASKSQQEPARASKSQQEPAITSKSQQEPSRAIKSQRAKRPCGGAVPLETG